ncbi:pyridoxamine 5'-phosphate oxidase [Colwellia sp. 4_MG-2023]|jgi:pyridoxamine 5'-phosphate oxidase|uniref:pyridoxamine 5'-phosphate oxidase n=1 Tax=unclassified Colwellia TaxID=196834 RepID=UPI001C0A2370|nr:MULTISPECIES: pyridoxamine 5'-phosphate oxidase [unclassified Colwellia]MBU2923289.1 pyridoxamine 5'-phosphate oxidase [Colwellia sp. C2M11]MDO6489413.1 pyridoxamine 5'-phosphate oxidase [Colwellia sp. 6_MG-2023]MDO6507000.1 pyridoxamine 5'-phosphate oxidase [Colwellia sp. 5_MG-2023]MDO6557196.1 pyridoxamine 5'-phosphate oxidase [Colwellia sp. 4_MG-2023]MDO6653990.1 pyridoxamine 5'-phosphate oxidase [Colwellia sp. 3_MG-2023]
MTLFEKLRCLLTFGQGVALPLPEIPTNSTPFPLFKQWFEDANKSGILLPEAVSVSTCGHNGQPSSRMVLLKKFDEQGFVFFTNYGSRKSQELNENDKVALLFHWNVLQRQIRIEGTVEKVSTQESADYFHSRDRGSQVGAWASKQSQKLTDDDELKKRMAIFSDKYATGEVPHPEFWGGWRVKPTYIEFWQGRSNRLHDRVCFEKQNNEWVNFKLHP